MNRTVEPNWIDVTYIGSRWDVQTDVHADPKSPDAVRYRHRPHSFSGQVEHPWNPGSPR
jgi:hypothetical protein